MSQIFSIAALLTGSGLLLLAGGLHGLLLPLRGTAEGFSDTSLGLLGTGWAIGYVAGCIMTPMIVSRVGHIRTFGVFCSLAGTGSPTVIATSDSCVAAISSAVIDSKPFWLNSVPCSAIAREAVCAHKFRRLERLLRFTRK